MKEKGGLIIDSIKIIDAPCGTGKTSWAIQEMNEHPDRRYIFCTPFLDEIYRIRKACGFGRVYEPKHQPVRKIDDFHSLLNEGKSIATTHNTFLNTSINETAELIAKGDYTLILDECIDAVRMYPGTVIDERGNAYSYGEADIRLLEENGGIEVREDGSIHVNEKKLKGTRYEDLNCGPSPYKEQGK